MPKDNNTLIWRCGSGCDEAGAWYVKIAAKDPHGQTVKEVFSLGELANDTKTLWGFLGRTGHVFARGQREEMQKTLLRAPKKERFRVATQQGWHDSAFVTPHRVYGAANYSVVPLLRTTVDIEKWTPRGSRWKDEIRAIVEGNPLLQFLVLVACMPPVLPLLQLPSVGFSLVGPPGFGKTPAMVLAGSVWGGDPERPLGFCETFLRTANSLGTAQQRYRHSFLGLDETHLADAQTIYSAIHRLSAGESKQTAIDDALPVSSCLVYVATSNRKVEEILRDKGLYFDHSLTNRLVEIGVNAPEGIFQRVPAGMTLHNFVERIYAFTAANHGTAIDQLLEKLTAAVKEDRGKLIDWIKKRMSWMSRQLKIDGNVPGEARRGQYFCVAYAVGRLAERYGVIPWGAKESAAAVRFAYEAHRRLLRQRSGEPSLIERLGDYIEANRSKFIDARVGPVSMSKEKFDRAPGFHIRVTHEGPLVALSSKRFAEIFGSDTNDMLRALKTAGALKFDRGKRQIKHAIRAGAPAERVYCIRLSVLDRVTTALSAGKLS